MASNSTDSSVSQNETDELMDVDEKEHPSPSTSTSQERSIAVLVVGFLEPQLVANELHSGSSTEGSECTAKYLNITPPSTLGFLSLPSGKPSLNFGGSCGGPYGPPSGPSPDSVPGSFKLENIGGLDEQKAYLNRAILLPFTQSEVLKDWGVTAPKGVLLHGPPGTGKTVMAKAIYNELKKHMPKVKFFYRKGGDVFSKWYGESQKNLRVVFAAAKSCQPSVLFFDEIDGLCPSREGSAKHGTDAYNTVVTAFLGQMDALENDKVFVIGSTNRLEAVDPAVRRPGRFDKHLAFGFPDEAGRKNIIKIYTNKWEKTEQPQDPFLQTLAQRTLGFSGADLEKLCNDTVYAAIANNKGRMDENVKITEQNWLQALNSMRRTASGSFGSALFIPTKPNQTICKLIEPTVDEAVSLLQELLQASESPEYHSTNTKSALLYKSPTQSKHFLNSQILEAILSHNLLNKVSLFHLSTSNIINNVNTGAKSHPLMVINDVINQALEASMEKRVCVVVSNIDELMILIRKNKYPIRDAIAALKKVRGPNMVLLATSSVPPDNIEDILALELFWNRDNHLMSKRPGSEILSKIFGEMFAKRGNNANAIVKKAVEIASTHDAYEHILSLIGDLNKVAHTATDEDFEQRCERILEYHQKNRP